MSAISAESLLIRGDGRFGLRHGTVCHREFNTEGATRIPTVGKIT